MSDDNFSGSGPQATRFTAVTLDLDPVPAVEAVLETPSELRFEGEGDTTEGPDRDDPAIYLDPTDPNASLVVTAMKDDGLWVYDLAGQELSRIDPGEGFPPGEETVRYNNVDIVYGIQMDGFEPALSDVVVASGRANDTVAIFEIDAATGTLTDITATVPESIFGVDDGETTAYGLATWSDPATGRHYAFVTQADGARVAQLELSFSDAIEFAALNGPDPAPAALVDALIENGFEGGVDGETRDALIADLESGAADEGDTLLALATSAEADQACAVYDEAGVLLLA